MVITRLEDMAENTDIRNITVDCFGTLLLKTSVMWEVNADSNVNFHIREIAKYVRIVLERQYQSYLKLSPDDIEKMHSTTGKKPFRHCL